MIVALSRFSSDFSHSLAPCDLHCVQLLLLKINCTSKLSVKIPILFHSITSSPVSEAQWKLIKMFDGLRTARLASHEMAKLRNTQFHLKYKSRQGDETSTRANWGALWRARAVREAPGIAWASWTASYSPVSSNRSYSCGDSPAARGEGSRSNTSASPASRRVLSSPSRRWLQNCRLRQRGALLAASKCARPAPHSCFPHKRSIFKEYDSCAEMLLRGADRSLLKKKTVALLKKKRQLSDMWEFITT